MSAGRYTFEHGIGRGASGAVWSGHDTVLGRKVALKRVGVHVGGTDPDLRQAAREARLAASLNHPHVVGVFDLVVIGDEHWLVMEHVDGQTLAQLVRDRGPLEPREAARLMAQVAEALGAAHRAGIVHRDVKPSNVMVTRDGTAKLTDFGIARTADDASLTQTGLVTGSPAYLSPEVATGSSATPASDVWALGATLYHLLAGRPPYDVGDNVLSTMYRIVHEVPPRLPETGRLNVVLERTMAQDPAQRWTARQVQEALTHIAGSEPTQTPTHLVAPRPGHTTDTLATASVSLDRPARASSPRRSPEPTPRRRHPWLVRGLVAAGVALCTVAAFYVGLDGARDSTTPDDVRAGDTSATRSAANPSAPTEADLESFVTDYLATVTDDQRATWERLTPAFQERSKGFGSYAGFWQTVESATPSNLRTDVDAMTVSYDVVYRMRDGESVSDQVTLVLERDGDELLIAGES